MPMQGESILEKSLSLSSFAIFYQVFGQIAHKAQNRNIFPVNGYRNALRARRSRRLTIFTRFFVDFCLKMWYNEQFVDHCSWFIDNRHQILHICKPQRGKVLGISKSSQ